MSRDSNCLLNQQYCLTVTGPSHPYWCSCSDFFLLRAEQGCVLGEHVTSNIISYVSSRQKMSTFFVKRKMPILFPVNCERTNSFSVKRDLNSPHHLYHPLTCWCRFSKPLFRNRMNLWFLVETLFIELLHDAA